MKSVFHFSGLLMFFAAALAQAQEAGAPARKVRLMAVGDPPPFQQEYRNGVRHESEAPPGSIPPRQIELSAGTSSKGAVRLALGETTPPVEVPGEAIQVNLQTGGQVWHTINLPAGGDFLVILLRDPALKKWDKARSILVPEGTGKFDEGDIRFISLTAAPLRFQVKGTDAFEVPAGKTVTKKLGVATGAETLAQYRDPEKGWKKLWSSALVQNRGERSTVLVYAADGVNPRQPLKLVALREKTAPATPPAPAVTPPTP